MSCLASYRKRRTGAAAHPFLLRRAHRIDAAALKTAVGLGIGITDIGSHCFDLASRDPANPVKLSLDRLALAYITGYHGNVEHRAPCVVHRRMCCLQLGSRRRLRAVVAMLASGSVRVTFMYLLQLWRASFCVATASSPRFSAITSSAWRSTRLSQLTLARISDASTCTTSAVGTLASRQALTVRRKIARNCWRILVGFEWSGRRSCSP